MSGVNTNYGAAGLPQDYGDKHIESDTKKNKADRKEKETKAATNQRTNDFAQPIIAANIQRENKIKDSSGSLLEKAAPSYKNEKVKGGNLVGAELPPKITKKPTMPFQKEKSQRAVLRELTNKFEKEANLKVDEKPNIEKVLASKREVLSEYLNNAVKTLSEQDGKVSDSNLEELLEYATRYDPKTKTANNRDAKVYKLAMDYILRTNNGKVPEQFSKYVDKFATDSSGEILDILITDEKHIIPPKNQPPEIPGGPKPEISN